MIISIGPSKFNVLWGVREGMISLYPKHTPGIKARVKDTFKVTVTNCVISEITEKKEITQLHHKGTATCSPRDHFDPMKGKRKAFVRAIDTLLAYKFPGPEKDATIRLIRRGVKQDIFDAICDEGLNKEIGI